MYFSKLNIRVPRHILSRAFTMWIVMCEVEPYWAFEWKPGSIFHQLLQITDPLILCDWGTNGKWVRYTPCPGSMLRHGFDIRFCFMSLLLSVCVKDAQRVAVWHEIPSNLYVDQMQLKSKKGNNYGQNLLFE